MQRRDLLKTLTMAGVAGALRLPVGAEKLSGIAKPGAFQFIFFTDTHIEPELNGAEGTRQCFAQFSGIPADFAISGGDLVYDAMGVPPARSHQLFDLFKETAEAIQLPVHYTLGNHDLLGLLPRSGVSPTDPEYGKKAFEDRYGPTHYSFDHRGWHFVILDSLAVHPDRTYTGEIGEAQIAWLRSDLEKAGRHTPVIVVTHIPIVTAAVNYVSRADWLKRTPDIGNLVNTLMITDSTDVIDVLVDYNVRCILQGHTHINEEIDFRGLHFSTCGAVCGDWWRGPRAGTREGFSVVTLAANGDIHREYRPYGFHAVGSTSTKAQ